MKLWNALVNLNLYMNQNHYWTKTLKKKDLNSENVLSWSDVAYSWLMRRGSLKWIRELIRKFPFDRAREFGRIFSVDYLGEHNGRSERLRSRLLCLETGFCCSCIFKKQIYTGFIARLKKQRESDIARTIYQPPWKLTDLLYDLMCLMKIGLIVFDRRSRYIAPQTWQRNLGIPE